MRYCFSHLAPAMLWLGAGVAAAQTFDDFFSDTVVQEIRIDIRPSDWALLKLHYEDNTYYTADFRWRFQGKDIKVGNIAIRSRGRGSRSGLKPNIRIDFNRNDPGQSFLGMTSAILKANNQDGSLLHEQAVIKLWNRFGLPASREAPARLYINDQYSGYYLLTEEIRDEYTQPYLGEKGGELYKYNPVNEGFNFEWNPICTSAITVACSAVTDKWNPTPFEPEENKNDFDLTPTINFVKTINTVADADFERTAAGLIDPKGLLAYVAIENFSSDPDSFLGDIFGMNNFFLYRYKGTNLHQLLVWDTDYSFDWAERPMFKNTDKNVLVRRLMTNPVHRAEYVDFMRRVLVLVGGSGGWLEYEHDREYSVAHQAILDDTLKLWAPAGVQITNTNDNFENEVQKNRKFIASRPVFLANAVTAAGWQPTFDVSVSDGGIVNAATSFAGNMAPGSYVSIYGSGFSQGTVAASTRTLPTSLGGVSVVINGFLAPILFISPGQVNVQAPWELGMGNGTAPVTVLVAGATLKGTRAGSPVNSTFSNSVSAPVGLYAPGAFAVTQADGTLLTTRAAGAGDTLTIYANGLGPVSEKVATGAPAPTDHLVYTRDTPSVTIDGTPAEVLFSGLAPGLVGCYQVNVRVPPGVRAGTVQLVLGAGGDAGTYNLPTR